MANLQDKLSTNDIARLKAQLEQIVAAQKGETEFTGTATVNLMISCTAQVEIDFTAEVDHEGAIKLAYRYADQDIRSNPSELKEVAVIARDGDGTLTQDEITEAVSETVDDDVHDVDLVYGDVTLEDHELADWDIAEISFDTDSQNRFDAAEE